MPLSTHRQEDYLPCPYTRSNCPLFNPTFTPEEVRRYTSPSPLTQQTRTGAVQAAAQNGLDLSPINKSLPVPSSPLTATSRLLVNEPSVSKLVDPQTCYERHQQAYQLSLASPPSLPAVGQSGSPRMTQASVEQDFEDLFTNQSHHEAKPDIQSAASSSTSHSATITAAANAARAVQATPFISKLFHLLSQDEYSHVITWSPDGQSIVFQQSSDELLAILGRVFKHSNVHSLVRQLNIYKFRRLETVDLLRIVDHAPFDAVPASSWAAFAHPDFYRGATDLRALKPKSSQATNAGKNKRGKKNDEDGRDDTKRRKAGSSSESGGDDLSPAF